MFIKISLLLSLSIFSVSSFAKTDTEIFNWVNNPYITQENAFYIIDAATAWSYADGDDGVSCHNFEIYEPEVVTTEYADEQLKSMTINYSVNRSCWPEIWICQGKFTFQEAVKRVDRYDYKYDCKFVD